MVATLHGKNRHLHESAWSVPVLERQPYPVGPGIPADAYVVIEAEHVGTVPAG